MFNVVTGCLALAITIPVIILLHIFGYMINQIKDED